MPKISTVVLLLMLSYNLVHAQTSEQRKWLEEFSEKQSHISELKKAEADSLAIILGMPIRFEYEDGSVIELQAFENGMPIYHATENINAAASTSADGVWNGNSIGFFSLSGNGHVLGLWEAGGIPRISHQEYSGRITVQDGTSNVTQHATHVAGTMIAAGVNSSAKGMSYEGSIIAYNSSSDLSEITSAALQDLKVSNHSYGVIAGWRFNYFNDDKWAWFGDPDISQVEDYTFGFYNTTSSAWDNFAVNAPHLLVCKSAGNDRSDSGPAAGAEHWVFQNGSWVLSTVSRPRDGGANGFDCLNDGRGIAKNTLTIGAVNDLAFGYVNPPSVQMTAFSNWGPTDDGRIKPDIVANGSSLNSSSNSSNSAYASLSGTSMAAPNISGSLGLLLELQESLHGDTVLRSSTLKGLLLHTAEEAGDFPGPDYSFGWGLMSTFKAAQLMRLNKQSGNILIREEILNDGNDIEFQIESLGLEPLKITICWIDPGGTPVAPSLNPQNLMLVNDLDLRTDGPDAVTHMPWVLDPSNPTLAATRGDNYRDNIEQIVINSPAAGTYNITISTKEIFKIIHKMFL
jgi:trimeric autotransporter adhesin